MPDSPDSLSDDSFSLQLNHHRLKKNPLAPHMLVNKLVTGPGECSQESEFGCFRQPKVQSSALVVVLAVSQIGSKFESTALQLRPGLSVSKLSHG